MYVVLNAKGDYNAADIYDSKHKADYNADMWGFTEALKAAKLGVG